jgi:hypothetical protein
MGDIKEFTGLFHREGALDPKTATWSTIKHIPGVEGINKEWKTGYEREHGR